MKIGLFGGTFDPIHCAHLIIAQYIKEELDLDKLIFIPSGIPPHKEVFLSAAERLKMVQLSIKDFPDFECSLIEINQSQKSYTVDTVSQLKKQYNIDREYLFLILGADNFADLTHWKNPQNLLQLCTLVVFPRNKIDFNQSSKEYRKAAIYLEKAPIIEISSTLIRSLIRQKRSIKYFVPSSIEKYINSLGLYL